MLRREYWCEAPGGGLTQITLYLCITLCIRFEALIHGFCCIVWYWWGGRGFGDWIVIDVWWSREFVAVAVVVAVVFMNMRDSDMDALPVC